MASFSPALPWRRGAAVWQFTRPLRRVVRSYVVGRVVKAVVTIFVVTSFTFVLLRLLPQNPVTIYMQQLIYQQGMTYPEAEAAASALLGIDLHEPLYLQYISYLKHLLHGDLGTSYLSRGTPVSAIILRFLPWTLFSVGTALLVSFVLGIGLGTLIAYYRESWIDHLLSAVASLFTAIPDYLLAIMLVVFLGVQTNILPIAAMRGSMSPNVKVGFTWQFIKDVLFHAALPIATYVLTTIGGWMLAMKSSTVATLEEDYVTVARAKGLPDHRISLAYVGRNAILPLVSQFAISLGFVVGGAALIERIFVYQGIGNVLGQSVAQRDYPVMQGVFLVITAAVVFANLVADLLYGLIDPRIRLSGQR